LFGVERMEGEAKARFIASSKDRGGGKGKRRSQPAAMRVEFYVWSGIV
jgi:hypothetical protein